MIILFFHEFKHARWKPAHFGKNQDWHHCFESMKKGRNSGEEKDETEKTTFDTTACAKNFNHIDLGNVHETEVKDI